MADKKESSELQHVWSVIHHDLASPLAVLQNNLTYLNDELLPKLIETYQKAEAAGLEIPPIRRNLLPFYQQLLPDSLEVTLRMRQFLDRWNQKLSPSNTHLSTETLEIQSCIKKAIDTYQALYGLKDKSRIQVNLEEALIEANSAALQNILYELFANAEYAPEAIDDNQPIVTLSSRKKNEHYQLHIKSTSKLPINEMDQPKIFDPFFTTKTSHLGLGLTFCQQAMQAMGGNINCKIEDNGKTVVFTLNFSNKAA